MEHLREVVCLLSSASLFPVLLGASLVLERRQARRKLAGRRARNPVILLEEEPDPAPEE